MNHAGKIVKGLFVMVMQALIVGIVLGSATAVVEVLGLLHGSTAGPTILIPAVVFYSAAWTILALGWGALVWLVASVAGRPIEEPIDWTRWLASFLLFITLLLIVGGHVNREWLPARGDPRSIAANIGILILVTAITIWSFRRGIEVAVDGMRRHPRTTMLIAAAAVLGCTVWVNAHSWHAALTRAGQSQDAALSRSGPNVLLITIDALRPDHVTAYGYNRPTTPTLDKLASEGVRFANAYATSCWTRASVASIFTSLFPSTHGVNGIGSGLSPSLTTLPEVMQSRGYATGVFSANSFISPLFGYSQGVDRFYAKRPSMFNELMLGHIMRIARKYSKLTDYMFRDLEDFQFPPQPSSRLADRAPRLNDAFLEWQQSLGGRPFFAYFHYMEAHSPWETADPFKRKFAMQGPYPHQIPIFEGLEPFDKAASVAMEQRQAFIDQYDGAIASVDHDLGQMLEELKRRGVLDNTVLIITADHGEEFYDHGGWGHGKSLYNTLVHIPLIVRYPALVPAGMVSTHVARHIDLLPTIAELAGKPVQGAFEGHSLLPILRDPATPEPTPTPIYTEVFHESSYARAIQEGQYKLIEAHNFDQERWLLFDLAQDAGEQHPLDPSTHAATPHLKQRLAEFRDRAKSKAVSAEAVTVDADMKSRLKSLGYVN